MYTCVKNFANSSQNVRANASHCVQYKRDVKDMSISTSENSNWAALLLNQIYRISISIFCK